MTFKQILQQRAKKLQSTKLIKKVSVYEVLLAPIVTEKTHQQQESHKYSFKVHNVANKNDVRQAIQAIYKVTPLKVNMLSVVFKGRNNRKLVRRAYKKAIVTLHEKDKIDLGA